MGWSLSGSSVHGILQAYGSGLPFPSPGDLPDPGIKPVSLMSPALAASCLPLAPPGKPSSVASPLCIRDQDRGWSEPQAWRECLFDISPTLPSHTKIQNESGQHKNPSPCHTDWDFSSVQLLSRVRLFAVPWIAARQASLSIINSQSLLKPMFIRSVMPSNHLTLCRPLLLLSPDPSQHQGLFQWVNSSHEVAKVLEFQLQH